MPGRADTSVRMVQYCMYRGSAPEEPRIFQYTNVRVSPPLTPLRNLHGTPARFAQTQDEMDPRKPAFRILVGDATTLLAHRRNSQFRSE